MYLGYNTNGFAFHRLADAIEIIAELGYRGVAITVDHFALNPFDPDIESQAAQVRQQLDRLKLRCVIETGARFLLDARRKHQPTLISPTLRERGIRIDFLHRCIRLAAALGADAVSFWSGAASDEASPAVVQERLLASLREVLGFARDAHVKLAFEPEPGMFIATVADALPIIHELADPTIFGLTVDIGHLHCQREGDIPSILDRVAPHFFNIHIDDMRAGAHDHLRFGEGEIQFEPILRQFSKIGYAGGVFVELSRHSHDAVRIARESIEYLGPLLGVLPWGSSELLDE